MSEQVSEGAKALRAFVSDGGESPLRDGAREVRGLCRGLRGGPWRRRVRCWRFRSQRGQQEVAPVRHRAAEMAGWHHGARGQQQDDAERGAPAPEGAHGGQHAQSREHEPGERERDDREQLQGR